MWLQVAPKVTFPGYSGAGRNAFIEALDKRQNASFLGSSDVPVSGATPMNPYASARPSNPAFFAYKGSLTTPPCTDGLQWLFMESPLFIAQADLEFIRNQTTFFKNSSTAYATKTIDGSNNRPTQPLNGRELKFSLGLAVPASSDTATAVKGVVVGAVALGLVVLLVIGVIYLSKKFRPSSQAHPAKLI